jgi:hypothetical protein
MAFQNNIENVSLVAASSLSGVQYRVMELNSSGEAAIAAANEGYGVLANIPRAGEHATVTVRGQQKVFAASATTIGQYLRVGSGGGVIAVTSGAAHPADFVMIGRAITGASSGGIMTLDINKQLMLNVNSGDAIPF